MSRNSCKKIVKIYPETKKKLNICAKRLNTTMTDLLLKEFRQLLKENGLPTI
jgi:hypothetical protein